MTQYRLTRLAAADLDDIWEYSSTQWGPDQADGYIADLFACFGRAVATPEAGRDRSAFVQDARSLRAGRHLVFYRTIGGSTVILRIVHQRRNMPALVYYEDLDGG